MKINYLEIKRICLFCLLFAICLLQLSSRLPEGNTHVVKKGENLYSIAKLHGLKLHELLEVNPGLTSKTNVKTGQRLNIPAKKLQTVNQKFKTVPVASTPDTPYRDEDNRNRIKITEEVNATASTNNEQPVVEKTEKIVKAPPFLLRTNSSNVMEYPAIFGEYLAHGFKITKNRGAANYLGDNTSGNQYLAFYNDAESGSVIKVMNMMNKKLVYVKVVGKVPAEDAGNEIILKLSKRAAHDLGALDKKFLVEVTGCMN